MIPSMAEDTAPESKVTVGVAPLQTQPCCAGRGKTCVDKGWLRLADGLTIVTAGGVSMHVRGLHAPYLWARADLWLSLARSGIGATPPPATAASPSRSSS